MTADIQTDQLPDLPYPGIEPFNYARRKVFFARDREARSLMQLISMYRGVLLYSDSGTGKSSLVNAGLIPLAVDRGFQPEKIRVQPRRGEEIIIERLSERADDKLPFLPSIFASDEQHERVVLSVEEFEKTLRQPELAVRPLLIFDQFEEWITLFEEGSRTEAANDARIARKSIREAIVSLINDRKLKVKVLIALREDYLAKLDPLFEQCPSLPDQYLRLTALGGDQVYRAIRGPFEEHPGRYQVEIGPALAKKIQEQFEQRSEGTDVHLTEVQIVCRSLFDAGIRGQKIDQHFTDEGGVQGILERYLELALESLDIDQKEPAVALLTRMLTSAGTRNVISEDDLLNRVENEDGIPRELLFKTLQSLEQEAKLIRRERRREVYYYEIASEFLVGWIRRKALERQRLVELRKLEEARRAEEQRREIEAQRERADEAQRRADEQTRIARRFRRLTAALAIVFLMTILLAVIALSQRQAAKQQAKVAEQRREEAQAALAVAEERRVETEKAKEQEAAQTKIAKKRQQEAEEQRKIALDEKAKAQAALAEAKKDRQIALVQKKEAENQRQITIELAEMSGDLVALEALKEAEKQRQISLARQLAAQAEFIRNQNSPLSVLLAVESMLRFPSLEEADQALRKGLASLLLPFEPLDMNDHESYILSVAFSPDGKYLATASDDKTARVWNATTGAPISPKPMKHLGPVFSVAFSPDSKYLATASYDKTARVWEATTGDPISLKPMNHSGPVYSVAFSPDGKYLATASYDKTARVCDATTGAPISPPMKHDGSVRSVAFSPDGKYLATASRDGSARLWEAWESTSVEEVARMNHEKGLFSVAFSPDGKKLATASVDGNVRLLEVASGKELKSMSHENQVRYVTFSPDGKYLATASYDGTARVWEVASGKELEHLRHRYPVDSVAFSPDGKYLAIANRDSTAWLRLWEANWLWEANRTARVRPEDLISKACSRLTRNLTYQEWQHYLGEEPYRKTCPNLPIHSDLSRELTVETNSIGMKLVYIRAGSFMMGSSISVEDLAKEYNRPESQFTYEFPCHEVSISEGFWMGQTEVTQGQYKSVMNAQPWSGRSHVKESANNPAVDVSWYDAVEFCRKLSILEGKTYRLPTEAEWEYACRAGTTTRFSFGDSGSSLGDYAWFEGNAFQVGQKYAHPVGRKKPNPWGLYDMHGNVWEWCSDWYGEDYYSKSPSDNPIGPPTGTDRCLRGGSWYSHVSRLRCSHREHRLAAPKRGPSEPLGLFGFRVVRSQR